MLIRNITNEKTPKVIGVGPYWIEPGEEKYVPDDILIVDEIDKFGKNTGKKVVLPALEIQVQLGMLKYEMDKKETPKKEVAEEKPSVEKTEEVAEEKVESKPARRGRGKANS